MKTLDLRKVTVGALALAVVLALVPYVFAAAPATTWDLTGAYTIEFTCVTGCAGTFPHTMNVTSMDFGTGEFSGDGFYNPNPAISWDVTGAVSGTAVGWTVVYNNINSGYTVVATGSIDPNNGSMSGTAIGPGQTFTWVTPAGSAVHVNTGVITYPVADGNIETGVITLMAEYDDGNALDDDIVQWAVRKGTCAAGTNTVFGNVDGRSDSYDWDGASFSSEFDTSALPAGEYCFIFNPKDDAGENDVRETRRFYVASTPEDKDACKKGGWENFSNPTFKNQGECVSYLESNDNAGKRD